MQSSSPRIATYLYTANLLRRNPNAEIWNSDIEHYVGEGLWKAYDSLRREASLRFGISELEIGVSDLRVIEMKVDNHAVSSIEGFTGKSVQITYLITLSPKAMIESVKGEYEEGSVRAYLAARSLKAESVIYADSREEKTSIFGVFPNKTAHLIDCPWGKADILSAIGNSFGSDDRSVNEIIYSRFLNGETAEKMGEKMKRLFLSSFQTFINSLSSVLVNIRSLAGAKTPAFLFAAAGSPQFLFEKRFSIGDKRVKINPIRISDSAAREFVESKSVRYAGWNQIARLRMGWLINK